MTKRGCEGELEREEMIKIRGLVADYTPDTPTRGCVPLSLVRRDTSRSNSKITKHYWDLGDGTTHTTSGISHTYTKPGTYTLRYVVENKNGCKDSIVQEIKVGEKLEPNFYADKPEICNGHPVIFYTTTPEDNPRIDSYKWSFGGNKRIQEYEFKEDTDSFSVTLTLENNGCFSDTTIDDIVNVKGPLARINSNYDKCSTDTFYFANNSLNYDSFVWRYDGKISHDDTLFFYENEYQKSIFVVLTVWNFEDSCVHSTWDTIVVNKNPTISVSHDTPKCVPTTVKFYDNSTGIRSRMWVVESGDTIYDQNPEIEFENSGNRKVQYLATGENKCPYVEIIDIKIPGLEMRGSVTVPDDVCTPVTVTLYDSFYNPSIPKSWIMGNGDTILQKSQKMSYVYNSPAPDGDSAGYTVSLTSLINCSGVKTFNVPIFGPSAKIKHTGLIGCNNVTIEAWGEEFKGTAPFKIEMEAEGVKTDKNFIEFKYTKSEEVPVYLTITDSLGCKSTIAQPVYYDPIFLQADLEPDTFGSFCPPLAVNFRDKSISPNAKIVTWLWEFGDGTTSNLPNPGKIYLEPGTYSVTLTVTDASGCVSKKVFPDLIGIEGPSGKYSFDLTESCTPATINFTSSTLNAEEIKWDMGDGTVLDGNDQTHEYTRPGQYIPLLILADTLGCEFILPPIDTINIYPNPEMDFIVKNACVGEEVNFENRSKVEFGELDSFVWYFGDNSIGINENETHTYPTADRYYRVKLVGVTEFGCKDSTERNVSLYGVTSSFATNKDTNCLGEQINFTNESFADTTIASYQWDFGNGTQSLEKNPSQVLDEVGWFKVQLITTDVTGCTDTLIANQRVLVGDTLPAKISELLRVSVVSDYSIDIKLKSNPQVDFYRYELFRETSPDNFMKVSESTLRKDTLLIDNSIVTLHESHCYKVSTENVCHYKMPLDSLKVHCSVEAQASPLVNSVRVDWNQYVGWTEVDTYFVYREVRGDIGNYQYLGKVPGNTTSYIDTSIYCNETLFYRILASEKDGNRELSWSDTTGASPIYINTVPSNEVWRISVEDDQYIHMEWLPAMGSRFPIEKYLVERSSDGVFYRKWELFDSNQFEFDDARQMNVDKSSYFYKMKAIDVCKDTSDYSNLSKSILLKVDINNDNRPSLSWSKYKGWIEGVEEYVVEIQEIDGSFKELGRTQADDTTFVDNVSEVMCIPEYCYRITAIRNQPFNYPDSTHSAISHSNVMCAPVESKLFVPNAFTVNNDDLNEKFEVKGIYIAEYNIKIFTRWGEKVFDSNSCLTDHWDGTYKGKPSQQGVYIYIIEALGADKKKYDLKGDITLLK